jgi:hypothetical protein
MVHVLWIIRGVDIGSLLRAHPLVIVVENCLNHSITDGLGHNLFGFLNALERELFGNIGKRDLGVADVDLFETELDYGVSQALNETQVLISLEETLILYQQLLEGVHVSLLYTCHNEVVWK